MNVLRIAFVDIWDTFPIETVMNYFKPEYSPIIDNENPEIIFYSCFGVEHLKYKKGIRVFFNYESYLPDFNVCDYTIGTIKLDFCNRVLYLPANYPLGGFASEIENHKPLDRKSALNREFCSFIYSQAHHGEGARLRRDFCAKLMEKYKHVACPGKVLHNCDPEELASRQAADAFQSKRLYCSRFKFAIAYENMDLPGYMTEKLTDCYFSNTVPIYYGSRGDISPFPHDSIICAHDFESMDALIEYVKEVDQDDEKYMSILQANPFNDPAKLPNYEAEIKNFILRIASEGTPLMDNVHFLSVPAMYQERLLRPRKKKNRLRRLWDKITRNKKAKK